MPTSNDTDDLRADVQLVMSGHFSIDSVGTTVHETVTARLRGAAEESLDLAAQMFLGAAFDPIEHAARSPVRLLNLVKDVAPAQVRLFAESLLRHYDGVLVLYDAAQDKDALLTAVSEGAFNTARRLDKARRELRALVEGL